MLRRKRPSGGRCSVGRDLGIADRLRAEHLTVVEVDGWQTRGSADFNPRGSVDHHTAGAKTGNAPSLGICINGRADLPGPLCNVLIGRNNVCYLIAAGRANHAGKGGWRGLAGNSSVYGIERENVGTTAEPWTADQTATAARAHAALIRGCPNPMPELVMEHKEWAPQRKSDAHTITGDQMRFLVRMYLDHKPDQEDFMAALTEDEQREMLQRIRDIHGWAATGVVEKTLHLVQEHVANPHTGGGAGQIDWARLEQELDELKEAVANELAERLKA